MTEILNDLAVHGAITLQESKAVLRAQLADIAMTSLAWADMTKEQRKACFCRLVEQSSSEEELREMLSEKLGIEHCNITWQDIDPNDKVAVEAQALVRAFGGPLSKTGALVMMMTSDGCV